MSIDQFQLRAIRENSHTIAGGPADYRPLLDAIALADFLATLMKTSRIGEILRESLTTGGWVSMWRPLKSVLV